AEADEGDRPALVGQDCILQSGFQPASCTVLHARRGPIQSAQQDAILPHFFGSLYLSFMLRVRFARSPTGYLHIGSARTFIFNWLYARRHGGTMILRIDDTDIWRNTQASLDSIFDGLNWLELGWDELYHQSERLELHRKASEEIAACGHAYRDFTPAHAEEDEESRGGCPWLFNPGMRELST